MTRPGSRTIRSWLLLAGVLAVLGAVAPPAAARTGADATGCYAFSDNLAPLDPGAPAFTFFDASATGALLALQEDTVSAPLAIGFPFRFYGQTVSTVRVAANGFLVFGNDPDSGCCSGPPLPSPFPPNGVVAGFWRALVPNGLWAETQGAAPARRLVVQFQDADTFDGGTATFEMVLFEGSNEILLLHGDARSQFVPVSVGLENRTGRFGLEWFRDVPAALTGTAVRFTPLPGTAGDGDGDGLADCEDVCPAVADPAQVDCDANGIGDACDPGFTDTDADGVDDRCDVCPLIPDPLQRDRDFDRIGDACDVCPDAFDPGQEDRDGDGAGDACDGCPGFDDRVDADGDTVADGCDLCAGVDDTDPASPCTKLFSTSTFSDTDLRVVSPRTGRTLRRQRLAVPGRSVVRATGLTSDPRTGGLWAAIRTIEEARCPGDPTRTVFAGEAGSGACQELSGDRTGCESAFHRGNDGVASCFYNGGSNVCAGCGPNNERNGRCVNTCRVNECAGDPARTLFAGPSAQACRQLDDDPDACAVAFQLDGNGRFISCFDDGGACRGCDAAAVTAGRCANTCAAPPSCAGDPSRTVYAGGPGTSACRRFNANPAGCAAAFHTTSDGEAASCFFDGATGSCAGCGPSNECGGSCVNTCRPPGTPVPNGLDLARIDPVTGVATVVGATGQDLAALAIACDGRIFGLSRSFACRAPATLFALDPSDGSATPLLSFPQSSGSDNLAFDPTGLVLRRLESNDLDVSLQTIDPDTLAVTSVPVVGDPLFGASALAYAPASDDLLAASFNGLRNLSLDGRVSSAAGVFLDHPASGLAFNEATCAAHCGDGVLDPDETCDDGNRIRGDCCSARCRFEPAGSPCVDPDLCTAPDVCDGAGQCAGEPIACAGCETCDPTAGRCVVAPRPACKAPTKPGGARLRIRDHATNAKDQLSWRWRWGDATTSADFGDPLTEDDLTMCVYDESGPVPRLVFLGTFEGGRSCGAHACWQAPGRPPGARGFTYRDRLAEREGLGFLRLRPGRAGQSRILLDGKGEHLSRRIFGLPALPLDVPFRVQLHGTGGACWGARYTAPGVQRNDATELRARGE